MERQDSLTKQQQVPTTVQAPGGLDAEGNGGEVSDIEGFHQRRDDSNVGGSSGKGENRRKCSELVGSKWMGEDGRKEKRIRILMDEKETRRGVSIILHKELRDIEGGGDYGKKFKDAMGTVAEIKGIMMAGGRREYEAIYGGPLEERLAGLGVRGQVVDKKTVEWGTERVAELWDALRSPVNDNWSTTGKVAKAGAIATKVSKTKRKRSRYHGSVVAMECKVVSPRSVINSVIGSTKLKILKQYQSSVGVLAAVYIKCGECSGAEEEASAAERVVAVQRSIQDLRKKFGCFKECKSYVVHTNSTMVRVVLVGPVGEIDELKNCIVPFCLMSDACSYTNATKWAPVSHLIARELFYAPDGTRRLLWALVNTSLLLRSAIGGVRYRRVVDKGVEAMFALEAEKGDSRMKVFVTAARDRCALITVAKSPAFLDDDNKLGVWHTLAALTAPVGHQRFANVNAVALIRGAIAAMSGGHTTCPQAVLRLKELVNRPCFFKGARHRVNPTSASLLAAAVGMPVVTNHLTAQELGVVVSTVVSSEDTPDQCPPIMGDSKPSKHSKHIATLSIRGFFDYWVTPKPAGVIGAARVLTGLTKGSSKDKSHAARMKREQRKLNFVKHKPPGYVLVCPVTGDPECNAQLLNPHNRMEMGHPPFDLDALTSLTICLREAES